METEEQKEVVVVETSELDVETSELDNELDAVRKLSEVEEEPKEEEVKEPKEEEEEVKEEEPKKSRDEKRREWFNKNRLAAENKKLEDRLAELEKRLESSKPKEPPKTRKNFNSEEDYIEWVAQEKLLKLLSESQEQHKQETMDNETYEAERKKQVEKINNFIPETLQDAYNEGLQHLQPFIETASEELKQFIADSDVSPLILYQLGNSPETVDAISKMSSFRQLSALQKIENELTEFYYKEEAPVKSSAPKAVGALGGGGNSNPNWDDLSSIDQVRQLQKELGY